MTTDNTDREELEPHKAINFLTALEHQVYRNHEYHPDECGECALTRTISNRLREQLRLERYGVSASSPVAPSLIPEQERRCEHGILWSMECLSCGPSDCVAAATPATATAAEQGRCDVSVTGWHRIDPPFCKDCGQTFAAGTLAATSGAREAAEAVINELDRRALLTDSRGGRPIYSAGKAQLVEIVLGQILSRFPSAVPVEEQEVK